MTVLRPGLFTTVQDRGRWGFQSLGVPVAGAMDPVSFRLANALVGNPSSQAALEVTLDGPELEFHDDRIVAVCGAEFSLRLDDRAVVGGAPIRIEAGSRLRLADRVRGARAYVAVSGGIDVPEVLGSRSTHPATHMGGLHGGPLRSGDVLPLGVPRERHARRAGAVMSTDLIRLPSMEPCRLRVLPGPDLDRFDPEAWSRLTSSLYVVTGESDRMGYRLKGPAVPVLAEGFLLSEATVHGALQVPADGQPILLAADRHTTGGYPKLAVVITADLGLVGQLAPGDRISFVLCARAEAAHALLARERGLMPFETEGGA